MASISAYELDATVRKVKGTGMVNRLLQLICVGEGLPKYGVKADLQQKIIDSLQKHAKEGNIARFQRLKAMIDNPNSIEEPAYRAMGGSSASPAVNNAVPYMGQAKPNPTPAYNPAGGSAPTYRVIGHPKIEFKSSPYFVIEEQLGGPTQCDIMTQHRHTVKAALRPQDYPILSRVQNDPNLKVMVFCAAEGGGKQDIAFPHQSEIKINGGEIKANLRGLKNKPGSTRPVDITKELRLNIPAYSNNVEMTYALTSKVGGRSEKFYLVLYVIRSIPVTDLVKKLENGKRITEKSVVDDMLNKARDADIVTTASVLSLKCPLSTLRISLPIRSVSCRHNQCFDATSYLQLQEQGPTWSCPICNNPAPFDSLAVDEYVKSILKGTSKSVDQVTIQPDAKWELNNKREQPRSNSRTNGVTSDSDDDIVEITKSGDSVRMGAPAPYRTPIGGLSQSRESSGAPKNSGSTSGKRPISAVIDLTSSGDEDEEPAPKRPFNASANPNGFTNFASGSFPLPARPPNGYPPRP